MRLIDASTTKVSITRFFDRHVSHQKSKRLKEHSSELCRDMCFAIDAQQTIDAVPVVRCRDCTHWNSVTKESDFGLCDAWVTLFICTGSDEYCKRGKKKEA